MAKANQGLVESPPKPAKEEHDYEAENGVDTLMRYHELKANPELMGRVKKHAGRKLKALTGMKNDISSIDDIRKVYDQKFGRGANKKNLDTDGDGDM
jgi:hypothetical protein